MYANYSNGITNLACSVLKYFGAAYTHDTLKYMDNLLQYPYNNVVVMLFDGMGVDTLRYHLPQDSFLRRHLIAEYSSVFPPTTTAATTSLESGLMPVEHGWLGWSLYFSEIDKIVGYVSLSNIDNLTFELHNLAILPEYRHKGYGKELMDFCKAKVKELGGGKVTIGIIEENPTLKDWYADYGFIHTGTQRFEHLPFTVGFMELTI